MGASLAQSVITRGNARRGSAHVLELRIRTVDMCLLGRDLAFEDIIFTRVRRWNDGVGHGRFLLKGDQPV